MFPAVTKLPNLELRNSGATGNPNGQKLLSNCVLGHAVRECVPKKPAA